MPSDSVEVHILDAVAIDMDFVITGQALDAFGDAAFGAMTLVINGETTAMRGLGMSRRGAMG